MRELEFRAWDTKNEIMYQVGDDYGTVHPLGVVKYFVEGQPVLLEQFTGLVDRKGIKIFENDVVHIYGYGGYLCVFPFIELYETEEDDIGEVLGNVHTNPELLESYHV